MPWKNPASSLGRTFHGSFVLKCQQCGSCCPPSCNNFKRKSREKATCKINIVIQREPDSTCAFTPISVYSHRFPFYRGVSRNGRIEYNCQACQRLVDRVFGKGKYSLALKKLTAASINPSFLDAVLRARTKAGFEVAKELLRTAIETLPKRA